MNNYKYLGNIVSAPYDSTIGFMFEGLGENDIHNYPNGPFNNTTRILLVDSILKNMTYLSENQRLQFKIENSLNAIVSKNSNHNSEHNLQHLLVNGVLKLFDNINSYKGLPFFCLEAFFYFFLIYKSFLRNRLYA
jgi:hypothetical protein